MYCNWPTDHAIDHSSIRLNRLTIQLVFNEVWLFTFSEGTHGFDVTVPKNYLNKRCFLVFPLPLWLLIQSTLTYYTVTVRWDVFYLVIEHRDWSTNFSSFRHKNPKSLVQITCWPIIGHILPDYWCWEFSISRGLTETFHRKSQLKESECWVSGIILIVWSLGVFWQLRKIHE